MNKAPLFELGKVMITPGAELKISAREIDTALHRHQHGDYGDMCPEDVVQNARGLFSCGMIMSVYHTGDGTEFWVNTHGTRSHTTILLPGE